MFFEIVDWFDSVHPVILYIICKTADLFFNAEHLCNANGGAIPKFARIRQENKAQNFVS